jgi:hypothetical protein
MEMKVFSPVVVIQFLFDLFEVAGPSSHACVVAVH